MKQTDSVILKTGKDKAIRNHHHWIFSGAIHSIPTFKNGSFLPVRSSNQDFLGWGYFNSRCTIRGRMVSFDETLPLIAIEQRLESALSFRQKWFDQSVTNAYRLINGDGDGIPGLTIDVYDKVVVLQSATLGIDLLKPWLVEWINRRLAPLSIYEKSSLGSRKEEGLKEQEGFLSGVENKEVAFKENGIHFKMHVEKSQKTGFFLDHREMRQWVRDLAKDKRVLNAFSYTGGFSLYALASGAAHVDSLDISQEAIGAIDEHLQINGLGQAPHRSICQDVFEFLRQEELPYDLVILDPPAFAKKQKDFIPGCRGYKDINRLALKKMPAKSLLLTCSCSHYVDESLFQKVIFQAAREAERQVRIIGRHRQASDHPINIFHPESHYLKSLLLYVE